MGEEIIITRRLNPFTDFGFKYIFGREQSKPILMKFLNELLADDPGFEKIVNITYDNKETARGSVEERAAIYDVVCTTSTGKKFIVEMQNKSQSFFINRSLYYVSKSIVSQEKTGDWDFGLMPVYMISFQNFVLAELGDDVRTDAMLCNLNTHKPLTNKVRLIYIQLPKFDKKSEEECTTAFDKWLYFLINMETMNTVPNFAQTDPVFKELANISDYYSLSKDERLSYDRSLKAYRDMKNQFDYAMSEGRAQGIAEGRAEGRAEGIIEGEEKALKATIIRMYAKKLPIETIADVTLSTPEYIKQCIAEVESDTE